MRLRARLVQPLHRGEEFEVLAHGQVLEQRELLGHVADAQAQRLGLFGDAQAQHLDLARGRRQQPAQHADGGRLAGPVRAEEAVDLLFRHVEVDMVDRDQFAEALGQAARADGDAVHPRSSRRCRRREVEGHARETSFDFASPRPGRTEENGFIRRTPPAPASPQAVARHPFQRDFGEVAQARRVPADQRVVRVKLACCGSCARFRQCGVAAVHEHARLVADLHAGAGGFPAHRCARTAHRRPAGSPAARRPAPGRRACTAGCRRDRRVARPRPACPASRPARWPALRRRRRRGLALGDVLAARAVQQFIERGLREFHLRVRAGGGGAGAIDVGGGNEFPRSERAQAIEAAFASRGRLRGGHRRAPVRSVRCARRLRVRPAPRAGVALRLRGLGLRFGAGAFQREQARAGIDLLAFAHVDGDDALGDRRGQRHPVVFQRAQACGAVASHRPRAAMRRTAARSSMRSRRWLPEVDAAVEQRERVLAEGLHVQRRGAGIAGEQAPPDRRARRSGTGSARPATPSAGADRGLR